MTLLLAALLSTQEQQNQNQEPLPNAAGLISNMMSHYAGATSLVGNIRTEIKHNQTVVSFRTSLQYDEPNRLFIQQTKNVSGPVDRLSPNRVRSAMFVTDGKQIGYDHPTEAKRLQGARAFENAYGIDGKPYPMSRLYGLAKGCMLEDSIPLTFLMADNDSLAQVKNKFQNFKTVNTAEIGGKKAFVIEGVFSDYPLKGDFQMAVDQEGNLYHFATRANIAGTTVDGLRVEGTIMSTYKIDAQVNPTTDKAKYKVR